MCRAIRALKKKQKKTQEALYQTATQTGERRSRRRGWGRGCIPTCSQASSCVFRSLQGFFCFSFLEETPLRARGFGSPAGSELRCIIRGPTCRQTAHNCAARASVRVPDPTARPPGGVLAQSETHLHSRSSLWLFFSFPALFFLPFFPPFFRRLQRQTAA